MYIYIRSFHIICISQPGLRLFANVVDNMLLQQFSWFVFQRLIVGVLNARVVQHQFALGQCQDAVAQACNNFSLAAWHHLAQVLGKASFAAVYLITLRR